MSSICWESLASDQPKISSAMKGLASMISKAKPQGEDGERQDASLYAKKWRNSTESAANGLAALMSQATKNMKGHTKVNKFGDQLKIILAMKGQR